MLPLLRLNSLACGFGLCCNREIAFITLVLDSSETFVAPFVTRDTVVIETPASLATSLAVWDMAFCSVGESFDISSDLRGRSIVLNSLSEIIGTNLLRPAFICPSDRILLTVPTIGCKFRLSMFGPNPRALRSFLEDSGIGEFWLKDQP